MFDQTEQILGYSIPTVQSSSSSDTVPVPDTGAFEPCDPSPSNTSSANAPGQTSSLPLREPSELTGSRYHKRILLMGLTGAGKSTFINSVAGSTLAVSTSLASCTQQVASVRLGLKDGTLVELVDTPGFNDSLRSDIEILDEIAKTLKAWDKEDPNIHGIIYIHRISDVRMSGSSRKSFSVFYDMCGEEAMPHVSIVTNMWDAISPKQGQDREAELLRDPLFFSKAIGSNAQVFRNDSPPDSTLDIVHKAIHPNPIRLLIQKELSDDKKDLLQTTAGIELDQEMAEKRAQHEAELLKINQEYTRAQEEQDGETLVELEEERESIRKKLEGMQALVDRLLERKKAPVPRQEEYAVNRGPWDGGGAIQSVWSGELDRKTVDRKVVDVKAGDWELSQWTRNPNAAPTQFGPDIKGAISVVTPKAKNRFGRGKSRSWNEMAKDVFDINERMHEGLHRHKPSTSNTMSLRPVGTACHEEPAAEEHAQKSTPWYKLLKRPGTSLIPGSSGLNAHFATSGDTGSEYVWL